MNMLRIFLFLVVSLVLASTAQALAVDIYTENGQYQFETGEIFVIKADAEDGQGLSLLQLYRYDGSFFTLMNEKNCKGKRTCDITHNHLENEQGTYNYYAYAYDMQFNYIYDMIEVEIYEEENTAPYIEITYPEEGDLVSGTITVTGTSSDPDAGDYVQLVQVSTDNLNWNLATGTTNWQYNLDTRRLSEGANTIYARAFDGELYGYDRVNVVVDNQAPTELSIIINNGDEYTSSVNVNLTLFARDANQCRYRNEGEAWTNYQPYTTFRLWTLTAGEGLKTVYYQCIDSANNPSEVVSDTITLRIVEELTVSITANPTSGYAPLTVQFASTVSGGSPPYTYEWDFNNDGVVDSNNPNPIYTYRNPGNYLATLTVTDSETNTASDSVEIEVLEVPELTVSITANPTIGYAPLTVQFTSTVSGGIPPYSYYWGFGDNKTSREPNPEHIYRNAGNYTARLVVVDSRANTAEDSIDIEVLPVVQNTAPYIEITYPEEGNVISGVVRIRGVAYDNDPGDAVEFVEVGIRDRWRRAELIGTAWYFDADTTQVPDGRYTVNARAFDGELYGYDQVTVYVDNIPVQPLKVSITADPTSGYVPLTVQFNSRVVGGVRPYTYNWDFGDGEGIINGPSNPTHEYTRAGNFTATLIVYDRRGDFATASVDIEVWPVIENHAPEIEITYPEDGDEVSGTIMITGTAYDTDPGDKVEFVDVAVKSHWQRARLVGRAWYFNADTTELTDGWHIIYARASDGELYGYDQVTVYVNNIQELTVSITANPTSGYAPLTVQFTSTVSGGVPPYTYEWDFNNDGVVDSNNPNPDHIYKNPGNYTATLTVTDSEMNTASDSIKIEVLEEVPELTVEITADPTRGYEPLTVHFTSNVSGGIPPYRYDWDFGDDEASSEPNPDHIYKKAGNYLATLTVTDSEMNTATDSVKIEVLSFEENNPPYIEILYPQHGETVSGRINVEGIAYDTDPGDKVESVEVSIDGGAWEPAVMNANLWSYALNTRTLANGWHLIETRAYDGELYGYDKIKVKVDNYFDLDVSITADPTSGDAPLKVQFNSRVTGGTKPYTYAWDFNNDGVIDSNEPHPSYTYYWPYTYTAKLYVFDADGKYGIASIVIEVTGKPPYKPEEPEPEEEPYSYLTVSRIRVLSHGIDVDQAEPGDEIELIVDVKNTGDKDFEDVKVMFAIPDLGLRRTVGPFELKEGKTTTRHVYMEIPYDTVAGEYDIRITVSCNELRRVKYRYLKVI